MRLFIGVALGVAVGYVLKDYKIAKNTEHMVRTNLHPKA